MCGMILGDYIRHWDSPLQFYGFWGAVLLFVAGRLTYRAIKYGDYPWKWHWGWPWNRK